MAVKGEFAARAAQAETPATTRAAQVVVSERSGEGQAAVGVLRDLGLDAQSSRPVIVVSGGATSLGGRSLDKAESVLGPGVSDAALAVGAALIDGGTDAGVMAVVGNAFDMTRNAESILLGVAPEQLIRASGGREPNRASLEPHHTHIALAQGDSWGDERRLMFELTELLADRDRVAVVVAGGGEIALEEVLAAVKRRWPIFVIAGTGGLADRLARRRGRDLRAGSSRLRLRAYEPDARLRSILRNGDLRIFHGASSDLSRRLVWELRRDRRDELLKDAWSAFDAYDRRATALRRTFERYQRAIIGLGIAGTGTAILFETLGSEVLRWATIAIPAITAVVVATLSRRAPGKRWVLLRAAAETLKSEIYRCRTAASPYSDEELLTDHRDRMDLFAGRVTAITSQLALTDASNDLVESLYRSVPPRLDAPDDGLSDLEPRQYLTCRLDDQLRYYRGKVRDLHARRTLLQVVALTVGASGTVLAAIGAEIWVAFSTAIAGGMAGYLATLQVDNTIVVYNQNATRLSDLRREWRAGQGSDPDERVGFERLVIGTELALTSELSGWVQQMNNAIEANEAGLAAQQAQSEARDRERGGGA